MATIGAFKGLVKEKVGIPVDEQRLIFCGKELEDSKSMSSYTGLNNRATIFLVLRLPGGSEPFSAERQRSIPPSVPKHPDLCMLCFIDEAMKMPCGHPICPCCLMDYAWSELNTYNRVEFRCPQKCDKVWDFATILNYGTPTDQEVTLIQEKLSVNFIQSDPNIWECPGCNSYCERKDKTKKRVFCKCCSDLGKNAFYCYNCFEEWKDMSTDTKCPNEDCRSDSCIKILLEAPLISPSFLPNCKTPSKRACVECGIIIELSGGCKHVLCKACQTEFCFVCLRRKSQGKWMCGSYNTECKPAPRQERKPKKK